MASFGPVWDYDPSQWRQPVEQEQPVKTTVETGTVTDVIPVKRERPILLIGSSQREEVAGEDFEISSSSGDNIEEPQKYETLIPANRFPLDDELHRRVEHLLDEAKAAPDPQDLPPPKVFKRPTMEPKPPRLRVAVEADPVAPAAAIRIVAANPPKQANGPDWRPKLTTVKETGLISVNEISKEQFRQPMGERKKVKLHEIQPGGGMPPRKKERKRGD
jgi:hypothetical protein